jgi:hypothetical protein
MWLFKSAFELNPEPFFSRKKKRKKKKERRTNCKDLGVGQNLTKFVEISIPGLFVYLFFLSKEKIDSPHLGNNIGDLNSHITFWETQGGQ